jgi:hypothetical protein
MDTIWGEIPSLRKLIWCISLPIIALITELLQLLKLMPGTFDLFDMLCYALPTIVFLLLLPIWKVRIV